MVELAERCHYWPEHAQQVARVSLALFDQTRGLHGLTDRERQWLEYAALLHDIGVHISYEKHHRHSYYLIKHGDLRGFDPQEIELMALVARYHRRATPKKGHPGYTELPTRAPQESSRCWPRACGWPRASTAATPRCIGAVSLHDRGRDYVLQLHTSGDAELELWSARPARRSLRGSGR